jgi:Flp pilus assembly pilin Flp
MFARRYAVRRIGFAVTFQTASARFMGLLRWFPLYMEGAPMKFPADAVSRFTTGESGAVTVDWVVLTAAIVALGLVVMVAIEPAIDGLSTNIADSISAAKN